jgi:tRNA pseudouridine55 synthase
MALHGVALVDKPAGMSSFSVVSRIRRVFRTLGVTKAGHTGTLDPLATGLLPICVGEATKFAQRLLDADKGYAATVKLGIATTTADAEGEITARNDQVFDRETVEAVLAQFRGPISQMPPIYSALKIAGKPAYEYARAGKTVRCSKGTYIRSLAVDIAEALGSVGHLAHLRRTLTGGFDLAQARPLDQWMDATDDERRAWLVPTDSLVAELPTIALTDEQGTAIRQGKVVVIHPAHGPSTVSLNCDVQAATEARLFRLYDPAHGFLGLGALGENGLLRAERLLSTKDE